MSTPVLPIFRLSFGTFLMSASRRLDSAAASFKRFACLLAAAATAIAFFLAFVAVLEFNSFLVTSETNPIPPVDAATLTAFLTLLGFLVGFFAFGLGIFLLFLLRLGRRFGCCLGLRSLGQSNG